MWKTVVSLTEQATIHTGLILQRAMFFLSTQQLVRHNFAYFGSLYVH